MVVGEYDFDPSIFLASLGGPIGGDRKLWAESFCYDSLGIDPVCNQGVPDGVRTVKGQGLIVLKRSGAVGVSFDHDISAGIALKELSQFLNATHPSGLYRRFAQIEQDASERQDQSSFCFLGFQLMHFLFQQFNLGLLRLKHHLVPLKIALVDFALVSGALSLFFRNCNPLFCEVGIMVDFFSGCSLFHQRFSMIDRLRGQSELFRSGLFYLFVIHRRLEIIFDGVEFGVLPRSRGTSPEQTDDEKKNDHEVTLFHCGLHGLKVHGASPEASNHLMGRSGGRSHFFLKELDALFEFLFRLLGLYRFGLGHGKFRIHTGFFGQEAGFFELPIHGELLGLFEL